MGAETSTLQSIESLNKTLTDIENKLGIVEDIHLHHERSIFHDDSVTVAGKSIRCNSLVRLTVGPVIGLLGQGSARILVEATHDTYITYNLFIVDDRMAFSRFVYEKQFAVKGGIPTAEAVGELIPDTHYAVYVGGVHSDDVLLNYATFKTLPTAIDASLRIIFTHSERIDSYVPGEISLHDTMAQRMREDEYRWRQSCSRDVPSNSHLEPDNQPHMIIHNGNFVDVAPVLYNRVMSMMEVLLRDDSSLDTLDGMLAEAEIAMRNCYRNAFSDASVSFMLRRTSNIFLSGQGESASLISSLLAVIPTPIKLQSKFDGVDMGEFSDDDYSSTMSRSQSATIATSATGHSSQVPINKLVFDGDNHNDGSIDPHTAASEELRLLLMGAVLRIARRVCWAYMRQLWDEDYSAWATQEQANEEFHSTVVAVEEP